VGAGQPEAANRSFSSALALGIGLAALVAVLFVVLPGPLLRIFTDDPTVVALGRPLLAIGALFQLFDAIAIITEGSLRGAGDTRWPFLVVTAFGWGLFVPLAYVLGVALEGGLSGAWSGGVVSLGLMSMVLVRRFRSGAWQRIRI
jgi:MATE family multidrug resistance protein